MKLRLRRIAKRETYTIGRLEVLQNGAWVRLCDTCEDKVRDLPTEAKVMHETAIPAGTYDVKMTIKSYKYSDFERYPWAKEFDGFLPRLMNVPYFEGILLHVGNHAGHSSGCILVGENKVVGQVVNSKATFQRIMREWFMPAKKNREQITIEIV